MTDRTGDQDTAQSYGVLRLPRRVYFGAGQREVIGAAVRELGTDVLVCTDARMAGSGAFPDLLDNLAAAGVRARVFADVAAELPTDSVTACIGGLHGWAPDAVLAVGGGSCLDHGKVTSLLISHGGELADYYGELKVPSEAIPVVAVPTTAGTGSEVTPVAVLSDPERELKVGISSPHLVPHTAVVDPELTYTCPPRLTADAAVDALAHCIESFTAVRRSPSADLSVSRVFVGKSVLSDQYALAGIELIGQNALRAVCHGDDRLARQNMMLAALYGGLALASGGTAAAHAIQYPVGAVTHTSHGSGVGALLPYVMEFNLLARLPEFEQVATALGLPTEDADAKTTAERAVDRVAELTKALGVPVDLAALGVGHEHVEWIAQQAMAATRLIENNPRALDESDLREIVRAAVDGDRDRLRRAR